MRAYLPKIKFIVLCCIAFTLTSYIWAAPNLIFVYAGLWLLEGGIGQKLKAFYSNKYAWLFASLFLLHVVGMIYTSYAQIGWFTIQVKASLIVFPVLFASEGVMDSKKQKPFMYAFITGCICNGLICLGYAIWKYYTLHVSEFNYMQFSIFLHPSYYSMYIDMAIVFIAYLFMSKEISLITIEKIVLTFCLAFFALMIVLLQSKAGQITTALLFVAMLIALAMKKGVKWRIVMLLGIAIFGAIAYRYISSGNSRIFSAFQIASGNMDRKSPESTQVRYYVWQASMEIIHQHPIIGTGTGDADSVLQKQYVKDGDTGALEHHLNSHNEYLQIAVALGCIGVMVLLACLLLPLFKSIKERRYVYMAFIVIILINFLVESMLETQAGTMFYGLLNSLLMFNFVI